MKIIQRYCTCLADNGPGPKKDMFFWLLEYRAASEATKMAKDQLLHAHNVMCAASSLVNCMRQRSCFLNAFRGTLLHSCLHLLCLSIAQCLKCYVLSKLLKEDKLVHGL
jgi:hypothetical protein